MRKILIGIFLVTAAIFWVESMDSRPVASQAQESAKPAWSNKTLASIEIPVPVSRSPREIPEPEGPAMGATPLEAAENYVNMYRQSWGVQSYHDLRPEVRDGGKGGGTLVKYSVYQDGYQVYGLSISVFVDAKMRVTSVDNQYRPVGQADTGDSVMRPEEIMEYAGRSFFSDDKASNGLMTLLYLGPQAQTPDLAYIIPVFEKTPTPTPVRMVFRAKDGFILAKMLPN